MKTALWLIMLLGWWHSATSQATHGVEQYCMQNGNTFNMIPVIYNQGNKGWYSEVRYNYEAFNTVSVSVGKSFASRADFSYQFTPVAGALCGQLAGGFGGINADISYKNCFFSTQTQYVVSAKERTGNFLYGWSQGGYNVNKHIDMGLTLQQTKPYAAKAEWEPGIFFQVKFGKWSLPLYVFEPGSNERTFALGLICEWESKNKRNKE